MRSVFRSEHLKADLVAALALVLALLLSIALPALSEDAPGAVDLDVLMARGAVKALDLRDAEGRPLEPRKAPEMTGRGEPDEPKTEPDYRGVVGYSVLQSEWEVSRFNTFSETPWMLPVYGPDGEGWQVTGTIRHKTPVLVVDQRLREEKGHKFRGYLRVIRLDDNTEAWIDVTQFTTVEYWKLELAEAVQYGYCIAEFRDVSRYEPMDRSAHRGTLQDGTLILMCDRRTARYLSKDREHNPLPGIYFRSAEESDRYYRTFLFFNADDLTLIY